MAGGWRADAHDMEIAPDIHLIPGTVGARPLQLFLLVGDTHILLLDTGAAADPERFVFPYLATLGLAPGDIDLVISTHADADHVGGNAALKHASPRASITCGEADRLLIQDPAAMIGERYNAYRAKHGIGTNESVDSWLTGMLGEPQAIDWTWRGGETLRLGRDWVVEILATPGHSPGHLTVFDPRSRTALMGDAIHGGIGRDTSGNLTFPAYIELESYLKSIEAVRALAPETLAGCHWDLMRGAEVNEFLEASLDYVRRLDEILVSELEQMPDGATLDQLIQSGGFKLSDGHPVSDLEFAYTFAANMDYLVTHGTVRQNTAVTPVRYYLET